MFADSMVYAARRSRFHKRVTGAVSKLIREDRSGPHHLGGEVVSSSHQPQRLGLALEAVLRE